MQTLQTARLTSNPPPLPLYFTKSINEKLREQPPIRPPIKAPGILRQRAAVLEPNSQPPAVEANPKTSEVIGKFFASQGIPFDAVDSRGFKDLAKYLEPLAVIPTEKEVAKCMQKYSMTHRSGVNFQKTVGPMSVTIDVAGDADDQMFLVFSIHYFTDFEKRENVVYLRKLLLSDFDASSFLNTIRRAVRNQNYLEVKFSSLVCPSDEIFLLLEHTPAAKRVFICCYQYMTQFVFDVLQINEFAVGLQELRNFVSWIKESPDRYAKYRRMQMGKHGEMEVPDLDDGKWCDTAYFLTRCLVFHDTFSEFVNRHHYKNYISDQTFNYLVYLHRLLQHCVKLCRTMSAPTSSISQVAYVYSSLKLFMRENSMNYPFQDYIRELIDVAFKDVTDPEYESLYNIATYLDPRYAYRDMVYSRQKWKMIEECVIQDFLSCDASMKQCYSIDFADYTPSELRELIRQELIHYRTVSFVERPEENECPFKWWGSRQLFFSILSVMAREYLATPAVSVDASYYFSFNGKLEYISNMYPTEKLQSCLTNTGNSQEFQGKGASENMITQEMLATLDTTAKRLQKASNFDLYTHYLAATEEERNAIVTGEFPPIPTVTDGHIKYLPPVIVPRLPPKRKTPPHRRTILYKGVELKAVPMRVKEKPLPTTEASGSSETSSEKDQDPPLLEEVKEEVLELDLEKVKDEPLDEEEEKSDEVIHKTAPTTPVTGTKLLLPVKVRPRPPWFGRQTSKPKQKFPVQITRRPLPPPISIRAAIPKYPLKLQPLKLPREEVQEKEPILAEEEVKLEPLDDFNPDLEMFIPPPDSKKETDPPTVINGRIKYIPPAPRRPDDYAPEIYPHRRKPCNRRCAVCGLLQSPEQSKNVTIDSEKMIIIIASVYRGECTLQAAKQFMNREVKTYICKVHYAETIIEIDEMLNMMDGDDVMSADMKSIENVLITAKQLRPHVTGAALRMMLHNFVERNKHYCQNRSVGYNHNEIIHARMNFDFYAPTPKITSQNDIDDDTIMPKLYRQPRKQVLEVDAHDETVKVIEQEAFKLPIIEPTDGDPAPGVCCYCAQRGDRMIRVPNSEVRLARWICKLGPEFAKRLTIGEENLICRSHFSHQAFSSRGRLLRDMYPISAQEQVISTYSIQGEDFIKVDERRTGTEETIDEQKPAPKSKITGRKRGRPRKLETPIAFVTPKPEPEQSPYESDDGFFYDSEYDDFEEPTPAQDGDSDYDPAHDRSKPKAVRYNHRVGGKFAKLEQSPAEE
ncbi:unnamed protein product [Caenorhabditis brenneri]